MYQSVYSRPRGLDQIDENQPSVDLDEETLKGMKKILVRFADKTSVQGIIYIKEAARWASRSVWIFLFLLGTAAVIWQLSDIVRRYLDHPIATTIDIGYSTLEFPTVTICNMNPLRMSMLHLDPKTEKFIKKQKEQWETSQFAGKPPPQRPPGPPPNGRKRRAVTTGGGGAGEGGAGEGGAGEGGAGEGGAGREVRAREVRAREVRAREVRAREVRDNYDYDYMDEEFGMDDEHAHEEYGGGDVSDDYKRELRFAEIMGKIDRKTLAKMGHQKNETILSCSFNGRKCTHLNFTSYVDKRYGNCFQFNGFGQRLKALKARDAGVIH
ncbi:hypothetical protein NP493_284g03059, partial [Ridgeia piscesae]